MCAMPKLTWQRETLYVARESHVIIENKRREWRSWPPNYMEVSEKRGLPQSSSIDGFSMIFISESSSYGVSLFQETL